MRGAQYRLLVVAALIGLISVTGGALAMFAAGAFDTFGEAVWWAFLRLTDPGYLGDDEGAWIRVISTILTLSGYVVFLGALVAIMTQWLDSRMERLESGLTPVARNGHVLILGRTNRTAPMIRELLLSRERVRRFLRRHGAEELHIVVLTEELDAAIAQDLRDRVGDAWDEATVTLRSGSPLRVEHLERVDFLNAAAVVVPGDELQELSVETVDTEIVKTLLSLNASGNDAQERRPFAVAELFDARKLPVARRAYRGPLEVLASDAAVSRLLAQNIRHPGLSLVYNEVLSLGQGSEFYIRAADPLAGRAWGELPALFPSAVVCGLLRPDEGSFRPYLNPEPDRVVREGDRLVLLAPGYAATEPAEAPEPPSPGREDPGDPDSPGEADERGAVGAGEAGATPDGGVSAGEGPAPETGWRVLVLGWSHKVPALLREFGTYRGERYDVDVASVVPEAERVKSISRRDLDLSRLSLRHHEVDYTLPQQLRELEPASYDSILLVASDRLRTEEEADARTMLGLLLLRDLLEDGDGSPQTIAEVHDPDNVSLLETGLAEIIVSPVLVSHMLAQIALRRELRAVFEDLFTAGGSDLTFRTPADYGLEGETRTFREIEARAREHGELALGVLVAPGPGRERIELAPPRESEFHLAADRRIVIFHNY